MNNITKRWTAVIVGLIFASSIQGQTVTEEDYKRAEQFLWSNAEDLVYRSEVEPNWADNVPAFWYKLDTRRGTEFFLVNTEQASKRPFLIIKSWLRTCQSSSERRLNLMICHLMI